MPGISGAGFNSPVFPFKIAISKPFPLPLADRIFTSETDAILARASPLNPSVSIANKSSRISILLVEYRSKAIDNSASGIPQPSSVT